MCHSHFVWSVCIFARHPSCLNTPHPPDTLVSIYASSHSRHDRVTTAPSDNAPVGLLPPDTPGRARTRHIVCCSHARSLAGHRGRYSHPLFSDRGTFHMLNTGVRLQGDPPFISGTSRASPLVFFPSQDLAGPSATNGSVAKMCSWSPWCYFHSLTDLNPATRYTVINVSLIISIGWQYHL